MRKTEQSFKHPKRSKASKVTLQTLCEYEPFQLVYETELGK